MGSEEHPPGCSGEEEVFQLTERLLEKWVKHPGRKDTARGIAKYWFHLIEGESKAVQVQKVLDHLVQKEWVKRREFQSVYGLEENHLEEIIAFLKRRREERERQQE